MNTNLPEYSSLEELKKDFTIGELVTIAKENNLAEWLATNFYLGQSQKLLDVVESGGSDDEIFAILCRIFNVDISSLNDEDAAKINASLDKIRARLNNKAAVVETQAELARAVWQGNDTICLTGENLFYIPLGVINKKFIGEGNTVIEVFFDDSINLDEKNITIENAQVFLRTNVNLTMNNSQNVKVIHGYKKRVEGDDLSQVLNVLKGKSPFESIEQYRARAENCRGVAVGYVTLNSADYHFDNQSFAVRPNWDLKFINVLRDFVAGKNFKLVLNPAVAERIYYNERRLQVFADFTFTDKLTVARLFVNADGGSFNIEG